MIPTIVSQALAGRGEIRLGTLTPVRDFNYVADTVAGFLAIAASPRTMGEVVNLGSGRGYSIGETARLILKLMGSKAKLVRETARVRPENSEVFKLICANQKARRLCGWRPRHAIEGGLKTVIRHIESRRQNFKDALYNV